MKSKLYKSYSILSIVFFVLSVVLIIPLTLSLVLLTDLVGKIVLSISIFGFALIFFVAGLMQIKKRKEKLKFFLRDLDLSDGVDRKFLISFEGPKELKEKVLSKVHEMELILIEKGILNRIEDQLEIYCNVNKDCYSPITFVKIKEEGKVFCQGDKVYGYQQGNYIEISFIEEGTLTLFLHEVIHLILERSGKSGDHHKIVNEVMEVIND